MEFKYILFHRHKEFKPLFIVANGPLIGFDGGDIISTDFKIEEKQLKDCD